MTSGDFFAITYVEYGVSIYMVQSRWSFYGTNFVIWSFVEMGVEMGMRVWNNVRRPNVISVRRSACRLEIMKFMLISTTHNRSCLPGP